MVTLVVKCKMNSPGLTPQGIQMQSLGLHH